MSDTQEPMEPAPQQEPQRVPTIATDFDVIKKGQDPSNFEYRDLSDG